MNEKHKNIFLSVILGLAVLFSWVKPLDSAAEKYVQDGLQRSIASYAVAKTLNAVISFAQGTELSFQIGIGATITPGQVLDPVNDLVEQFSELMLIASIAFGVMLILVKIGGYWVFSLLLTIGAGVWLWMRWKNIVIPDLLTKVVVALLFVRFSMPMVAFGSEFVYKQFLEDEYTKNQLALDQSSNDISAKGNEFSVNDKDEDVSPTSTGQVTANPASVEASPALQSQPTIETPATPAEKPGFFQRFKDKTAQIVHSDGDNPEGKSTMQKIGEKASGFLESAKALPQKAKQMMKFQEKIEKLKDSANKLYEHIVNLIVVFILQTIIIPIFFLWAMYKFGIGFVGQSKQ